MFRPWSKASATAPTSSSHAGAVLRLSSLGFVGLSLPLPVLIATDVFTVVPETSNLTLEQVDKLFKDNVGEEETTIKAEVAQDLRS